MTTVFAITGRQRHSLPHIKRRNYIHALETILEDSSTTDMLKTYNADYAFMVETYAGSYGQLADRHAMSYHNYDEILTENMVPMPRFPERRYSSDDITKGRIQISGLLRKNQPSTIFKTSKLQMPDHAEERKFKSTLPKPKPSGELDSDHKHSKCAVDVHRNVADCDSLDNGLVEALNNDRFIHVRSNSIYYCNATLNTSPSVGNSIRKKDLRSSWQKPDLNPQKDAHHTCPAEKKIKKHVFLACLILLLGAMCMLVVAIVDGWMMHNSGRGVNGKDTLLGNRRKFDTLLNSTLLLDNYNDTGPGNFTGNVFDNTND